MKKIESGFSLIELLVVVAIIGILAAVGTVGYGNYINNSKIKATEANLANLLSAIQTRDSAAASGVETPLASLTALVNDITGTSFKNAYDKDDTSAFTVGAALQSCTAASGTPVVPGTNGRITFSVTSAGVLSYSYCLAAGSTPVTKANAATLQTYKNNT